MRSIEWSVPLWLAAVLALAPAASVSAAAGQAGVPPGGAAPEDVALAEEMDAYLLKHVLAPRFPAAVDREHGGFHASFASDWAKRPEQRKFIVYQARNTWNAAAVALARPALRATYLEYTRHGVAYLRDRMWDQSHGGFHTSVRLDGTPDAGLSGTKMTYGQAFAVYALAVAHRATGDAATLELARRGYEWVEAHCREQGRPGYRSGVHADGTPLPDSDPLTPAAGVPGMGVPLAFADMNSHIHVLEAWTELLREWPDAGLRASTQALFELVRDSFYSEPGTLHLFLDARGWPVAGPSSFGHDVETGFLLLEAAEALGIREDPRTHRAARRFVDHALALGWNAETGQLYERGAGLRPAYDRSIEWWAQFEMVNALSLVHRLHGRETPRYRQALDLAWRFVNERLTDHERGGVYAGVSADGAVIPAKSHDWFAGYHTSRTLLLTSERLRRGR